MTVQSEFPFLAHDEEVINDTNGISDFLTYVILGDMYCSM